MLRKGAVEVIPFVESETPVNAVVSINAAQHATERHPHNASSSKSSNLSRYFIMLRLILEESTQVTKSSMFLAIVNPVLFKICLCCSPGHEVRRICYDICSHSYVTLLNELDGRLYVV